MNYPPFPTFNYGWDTLLLRLLTTFAPSFPAVHDDFIQLAAAPGRHRPDLGFLGFKRNTQVGLAVCGNSNVANGSHLRLSC